MLSAQESRIALNEARFREINERLARGPRTLPAGTDRFEFVCECGLRTRELHIELTSTSTSRCGATPGSSRLRPGAELSSSGRLRSPPARS